ncbi:hypothetical protein CBL_05381 [Carabus blaptoides fortunei]
MLGNIRHITSPSATTNSAGRLIPYQYLLLLTSARGLHYLFLYLPLYCDTKSQDTNSEKSQSSRETSDKFNGAQLGIRHALPVCLNESEETYKSFRINQFMCAGQQLGRKDMQLTSDQPRGNLALLTKRKINQYQ